MLQITPRLATLPLLFCLTAHAATFESVGMVQAVDLGKSTIRVNGQLYQLPNRVTESLHPNGGPVIHQLQLGTTVSFSGDAANTRATIDSMAILRQPTAEDLEQLQQKNVYEE